MASRVESFEKTSAPCWERARVSTFGPTQARSKMRRVVARIALCALCAHAAVPPLDPDAREEAADLIVVGRIVSATAEEVSRREGHVDSVSIGQLEVEVALKGDAAATQTVYWLSLIHI